MKEFIKNQSGARVQASRRGVQLEVELLHAPTQRYPVATVAVTNFRGTVTYDVCAGEEVSCARKFNLGVLVNGNHPQVYFEAARAYDVSRLKPSCLETTE